MQNFPTNRRFPFPDLPITRERIAEQSSHGGSLGGGEFAAQLIDLLIGTFPINKFTGKEIRNKKALAWYFYG